MGNPRVQLSFAFGDFFAGHPLVVVYLVAINILAFGAFAVDKFLAVHGGPRIRVRTLLGLAFIGGSVGSLLAMYLFRHKTLKKLFTVGIPLMMVMQVLVVFFLMNR